MSLTVPSATFDVDATPLLICFGSALRYSALSSKGPSMFRWALSSSTICSRCASVVIGLNGREGDNETNDDIHTMGGKETIENATKIAHGVRRSER